MKKTFHDQHTSAELQRMHDDGTYEARRDAFNEANSQMTVRELIERLESFNCPDAVVEVPIDQYNKRYPVTYAPMKNWDDVVTKAPDTTPTIRLRVSLPKEMRTSVQKAAA